MKALALMALAGTAAGQDPTCTFGGVDFTALNIVRALAGRHAPHSAGLCCSASPRLSPIDTLPMTLPRVESLRSLTVGRALRSPQRARR